MAGQRSHTGYGGQLAVMSELLFRKCNAAVPIIDDGLDVFAFSKDQDLVARLQVKAAQAEQYKKEEGYRAVFHIPLKQLRRLDYPPLYYALASRFEGRWVDFLVIKRAVLFALWNEHDFGTEDKRNNELVITVRFRPNQVLCGEADLTTFRNAWESLPPFQPPPVVKQAGETDTGGSRRIVGPDEAEGGAG